MSTGTSCHLGHLLQVSKKSLWSLILYNFFHDLIHVHIVLRQGQTAPPPSPPQGTKFWCQQKCLITLPFVASFKEFSLKSDFIHFFQDLIHVYSPGQGAYSPQGSKFWCQQKLNCHFSHLLLVSNHRWQQFLKNALFYPFPIQKRKGPNLILP